MGVRCICGCIVVGVVLSLVVVGDAKAVGTGGEIYGDPAPGRSPGPPVRSGEVVLNGGFTASARRSRRSESVVLEEDVPLEAPWCEDYSETLRFNQGSKSDVSLEISHPFLETREGIFPGVPYEG